MRALWLILLVGCGGKSGGTATIDNQATAPPTDGVIRVADEPLRDCPPGALEQLASGWPVWVLEDDDLRPQLDACLRGNLIGPGVVVYASAPPPPDSQREDGYPLRRVILGADGRIVAEGPEGGGDWIIAAASLAALVDLDGDGVHEVIEDDAAEAMVSILRVWKLDGRTWSEAGTVVTGVDDNDYTCKATWSVGPADAAGHRALVVDVEATGEPSYSEYSGEGASSCGEPGRHRYTLDGGALLDEAAEGDEGDGELRE